MRVKALQSGEYPAGVWHEPGDEFDFDGDKPGLWMEPLKKSKKSKTKEPEIPEIAFHTVHKGFGKWDVYDPKGVVVENGDNLKKANAHALVKKLNDESSED